MNNNQNTIQWILDNSERLNLSVNAFKWNLPFETNIFDCRVSIKVNGEVREGRGSADSEELSFLKGFSEAIDRVTFFESMKFPTTNGMAVHTSLENAVLAARCELIERDAFFCHYLTKTPFLMAAIRIENLGFKPEIFEFLLSQGICFQLSEMISANECSSFIFVAHGLNANKKPLGLMFGMGCDIDPIKAACSAVYEGLRQIIANLMSNNLPVLDIANFQAQSFWGPDTHMALCNDLIYTESVISFFFTQGLETRTKASQLKTETIPYEILQLTGELKGAPFLVVKATDHRLQDLYFGPTEKDNVNLTRLTQFTGKSWTWNMVNKTPHPLA
ncbi:YcaO-like family protein [Bdellovibrio reynosensis]|uniref:YcaO-like family protein n=1 Tax=Bdellovibrio reynosensis TaxID=2835041 RepID=A0ABY4CA95_9BACT|nr:YcaO-like family protein [Bdellovibrio reynosensis]UOF00827.1 YcaO-like family protein [Bdellovibrio reynosensis]